MRNKRGCCSFQSVCVGAVTILCYTEIQKKLCLISTCINTNINKIILRVLVLFGFAIVVGYTIGHQ